MLDYKTMIIRKWPEGHNSDPVGVNKWMTDMEKVMDDLADGDYRLVSTIDLDSAVMLLFMSEVEIPSQEDFQLLIGMPEAD